MRFKLTSPMPSVAISTKRAFAGINSYA
jgi:hypothetical protein